ncbi:hypothetical protein BLOT_012733 [Blomia tropicalis]|nr:hypothetical protein BLOT_012733 [Blomia tropicalis]
MFKRVICENYKDFNDKIEQIYRFENSELIETMINYRCWNTTSYFLCENFENPKDSTKNKVQIE